MNPLYCQALSAGSIEQAVVNQPIVST